MPTASAARSRRAARQRPKGPIDPALGRRIQALRTARGMTQAELAATDYSKGFISLLETGRTRISIRAAEVLARRLGVATGDLIGTAASGDERQMEINRLRAEQELSAARPEVALDAVEASLPRASGLTRARLLRLRGRALLELGRVREALGTLDEAMRALRTTPEHEQLARAQFDLARAHGRLDAPGEAINLALEVERRIGSGEVVDRTLELQVLNFLSNMFVRTGDFASADLRAERALKLAEDIADPETLGWLYGGLSVTRQEQGDLEAALMYARRSLAVFEQLHRERQIAETWNNIGWIYIKRSQHGRAEEALGRAERLASQSKNAGLLAVIAVTRAELEVARGHPDKAIELVERALAEPAAKGYARANAKWVRAQAVAKSSAPLTRIRAAYEEAITAFEDQPRRWRAQVHESFGQVLLERDQHRAAAEQFQRALELQRATP